MKLSQMADNVNKNQSTKVHFGLDYKEKMILSLFILTGIIDGKNQVAHFLRRRYYQ